MSRLRAAVVGVGRFGRNHVRVLREMKEEVELVGVVDSNRAVASAVAAEFGTQAFPDLSSLYGTVDAAVIAAPTILHADIAAQLLQNDIDILVEKPIAHSSAEGARLSELAARHGRILQVGHLERFNPAVVALSRALTVPLFFEVHRLSVFSARSLDIDVILDLMIHDLDIVLAFAQQMPSEVHAAGISVLSPKVDIANVRLVFPSGCIANLTASRVSTEQVRKLRLFQPGEYISVDYQRQDANRLAVSKEDAAIGFQALPVVQAEPLALEIASFLKCIRTRSRPEVSAEEATRALQVAEAILANIKVHGELVAETIRSFRASAAV